MADLRPVIGPALAAFGLDATVTVPGGEPVATTAIWLSPVAVFVDGVLVRTSSAVRGLSLPRADIPGATEPDFELPQGTAIDAAEYGGGAVRSWSVENTLPGALPDEIRVGVIPASEA
jgi:hypothetical protein